MSALAIYMLTLGKRVGGSDVCANEYTDDLINRGAEIDFGNDTETLSNFDIVVYTDAIGDNDARLKKARELNKPIIPRGRFLYEVSKRFKTVIAVSGCHGKTTCSAMLAHIFAAAEKKFTSHIGGKDLDFSNFFHCGEDYFITEACEYKKNFLYLKPDVAVILNSDADHIECYGSKEAVKSAYVRFAKNSKETVSLYCDIEEIDCKTFGYDKSADYHSANIKDKDGLWAFDLYEKKEKLCTVDLSVYGKHNVLNALAAAAAARICGISVENIRRGLHNFHGVERRFEKLCESDGILYYADYAHHPNELRASLKTVRKLTRGKLFVVFQPHTYSRTKLLFSQFVDALSQLPELLIYKTFAAREYFDDAGSALTLSQSIKKARYGDCAEDIADFISTAKSGDTVLFLGAGDIYFIAKRICGLKNRH